MEDIEFEMNKGDQSNPNGEGQCYPIVMELHCDGEEWRAIALIASDGFENDWRPLEIE